MIKPIIGRLANCISPCCHLLYCLILLFFVQIASAQETGLKKTFSLKASQITVKQVFDEIKKQTGYTIFYSNNLIDGNETILADFSALPLDQVLDRVLKDKNIRYGLGQGDVIILEHILAPKNQDTTLFTVSGQVLDENRSGLPGVSIRSFKSGKVSISDQTGQFNIQVSDEKDSLRFSYVGYSPFSIEVGKQRTFSINMQPSTDGTLDEVVVVGFGEQKKITTIGAQSSVKAADLKQPVANISNLLAGRIAGIIGVQRSGEPGYDNSEIYIRGISTFTSSGPLVLVDGVERSFNNIDPEDIESFSILKDASATAVYGVRGANGVILIQTKRGKVSKPIINVQYDQGITQFTNIPKFADGVTYMQMANEANRNSNPLDPQLKYSEERIQRTLEGSDPDLYPNVDWFKTLFNKSGENRRARVNANGGAENAKYYLSVGYYDETGMYKTDGLANYNSSIKFTRYNFTSNLNLQVTKTTKIDFGASGWISKGNFPGTSTGDIWGAAYIMPPIVIPAIYSDGTHAQIRTGDILNPYNQLTQTGYVSEFKSQLWSNARITQDLDFWLEGLSATAMFSFDNYNEHKISRTKSVNGFLASGRDADGSLIFEQTSIGSDFLGYSRDNGGSRQFYTEAAINYNRTFGKNNITGLILFNQSDREEAFADDFIGSIPFRYMGLAGRTTYAYADKYLAELNFGYNGSETFAPGKRFGFFPSFGLGWVASEEEFFKPISNAIQFLKFRFSYGIVGNSNIGGRRFAYISTVDGGNGGYSFGQNGVDNNFDGRDIGDYAVNVTWERAKKYNTGIEIKALKNTLSLTADVFREIRTGIFRQRGDVPNYVGLRNLPWANLGEINNKGIDATLDYNKNLSDDWAIGFRGNITWNRATIINDANAPWPYPWQQRMGRKLGQRFGYEALGLFESDEEVANSPYQTGTNKAGDIKYKDLNGDGRIDSYDQGPIGYGSIPEIVYGFGPTLNWKGWSLAAWFKGISNVDIALSGDGFRPFSQGGERGNLLEQITDRWTPENPTPNPFYPRLTYGNDNMNYENSTWWLKNGAFLRLQTVQLNYSIRQKPWLNKFGLANLDIYFIGYNLATFSGFKLWDVELGDGRGSSYPLTKTFNLGMRFVFN